MNNDNVVLLSNLMKCVVYSNTLVNYLFLNMKSSLTRINVYGNYIL